MSVTTAAPAPAHAQVDEYRQHMDNGIKLFQDRNYKAAIVEFEAAYRARPKASPLFNIALAEKALFNYPKAITALERALELHRDTMDEKDETAARSAIDEMRALLARLTVELSPPNATLIIDGEEQPVSSEATRVVELGPGIHRIGARADGYTSAEQSVTLASGVRGKVVKLALVPDKGTVSVDAGSEENAIAIDSRFVAYGRFHGMLPQGTHLVQIYGPSGIIYSAQVLVVAGKQHEVKPGVGGVPLPIGAVTTPTPPPPPKVVPLAPPKQGVFVLLSGSLLWPLDHPEKFPDPQLNSGGAVALRGGYRVNNPASFDVMLQYENVAIRSGRATDFSYTLSSLRLGLNVRLMAPVNVFHVFGSLGGGLTYDDVRFQGPRNEQVIATCESRCENADGPNGFLFAEGGVEFDLGRVLLGASLQGYFQSSRGIVFGYDEQSIYDSRPLIHLGTGVHAGYAFW